MTLAAAVMGACVQVFIMATDGLNVWLVAPGGLALGGASYLGAAYVLRVGELRRLPQLVRRRI
jgi:hypothetical protein